jgi:hypothetical protein
MLIINYLIFALNDPLSRFPQGGKVLLSAPSPVGEGWEGGTNKKVIILFMIANTYILLSSKRWIFPTTKI